MVTESYGFIVLVPSPSNNPDGNGGKSEKDNLCFKSNSIDHLQKKICKIILKSLTHFMGFWPLTLMPREQQSRYRKYLIIITMKYYCQLYNCSSLKPRCHPQCFLSSQVQSITGPVHVPSRNCQRKLLTNATASVRKVSSIFLLHSCTDTSLFSPTTLVNISQNIHSGVFPTNESVWISLCLEWFLSH